MTKIASLEIEIAANVARLTEDFGKARQEVTASMSSIQSRVSHSMKNIGERIDGVNEHIQGMQKAFMAIGELAMAGVVGEKIIELGRDFAETAEQIHRTAQMTGMTTNQVQELGFAAQATGASSASMTTGLRRLATMMLQAENGAKTAVAAFKDVGISQDEIKHSSPHELLLKIADAYHHAADNANKTANAQMLFGRAGMELIPTLNQGRRGLESLSAKARELGVVLDHDAIERGEAANEKFKEMGAVVKATALRVGADLMPAMKALAVAFVASAQDGGVLHAVVAGLDAIVIGATQVITVLVNALKALGMAVAAAMVTVRHPTQAVTIWQSWAGDVDALQKKQDAFFASLAGRDPSATGGESDAGRSAPTGSIGGDTGTRAGGAPKSHMAAYEQQLAAAKIYYQQTNALRAYSLQQEIAYWQHLLATARVTANDRIAIQRKLATLELAALKKTAAEHQQLALEQIQATQQTALAEVALHEQKAQGQLKSGQITQQQLLQLKQHYEDQRYAIEVDAQQRRIALMAGDPNVDPVALQKLLDQLKHIQQTHTLAIQKLHTQAATNTAAAWQQAFQPITQAFDTTVKGMILGTTTWQKGLSNLLNAVTAEFVGAGVRMVTSWAAHELAKTAATLTGITTRSAAEDAANQTGLASSAMTVIKAILNDAAKTFSGVFAALSGIPVVGPGLAAAAAPAAMATVAGVAGSVASSRGGAWQIPADRLNFVHKNETILPADKAAGLDRLIGGSVGAPIHIHGRPSDTFTVSQLQAMLKQMGRNFIHVAPR